jgi:hypothetical protein
MSRGCEKNGAVLISRREEHDLHNARVDDDVYQFLKEDTTHKISEQINYYLGSYLGRKAKRPTFEELQFQIEELQRTTLYS